MLQKYSLFKSQTSIHYSHLLVIGLFLGNIAISQPDHYRFSKIPLTNTYNTDDYQGGIQNWDISRDSRGFIYVANNFGLLEYDGNSWRRYLVENNTRARSVFVDADNRIYIGGQNQIGYFEADAKGNLVFESLLGLLDEHDRNLEDIWKIVKYENNIFFCSYLGLVVYDGKTVRKLHHEVDYDLVFQVANGLYASSLSSGLAKWNGKSFSIIPGSHVLQDHEITAIVPYQNNSLLIFQKNGTVYHYRDGIFRRWNLPITDFLSNSLINKAILLENSNIAIGTQNNGIVILSQNGDVINHLTKGKGLTNRTVLALHEDQFNNLWVGLNNGICMVELASPFSVINEQSGLPGTGYCATLHDNKLYLGTSNGLFYQEANPNPITELADYQLVKNSGGQVYNVQSINTDLLLAHHAGAFLVEDDLATQFYDHTGTWKFENSIGDNRILAGTYDGFVIFKKVDGQYQVENELEEFSESSRVFEFAGDSVLFMTHGYKGVFKIDFNKEKDRIRNISFYGKDKGLPSNILINVFGLGGNKLVFPAETGIYNYEAQQDTFVSDPEMGQYFPKEAHITAMAHDLSGNVFFLNDMELGYLERTQYGSYIKHTAAFTKIKPLLSDDLENIHVIDHQNVFFGAKEGFVHFNPSMKYLRDQPFRTFIRSIEATTDEDRMIYGGTGQLASDEPVSLSAYFSSLKFRFASPYYDGQDQILFQYQLENFEKDWSEWNTATEKEYTNLSEGLYTFRVRAKNVFGDISEEASFQLKVYPPWYRSKLAYGFYGLGLLVVFGASMLVLSMRHSYEKKKLTLRQKRELLQKENEIVEVSKKSEEQISKLRNDKLRSEIDHKNRELATTTMHLINKNEFMLQIRNAIKETSKSGSKDNFKKIIRDIDRNLSEDEGWEQFTKHFDQVHGDFLSNIKKDNPTLTPQEIKLCAYLRMNMSSKEIANLLNISVRGVEISRYRLRKKLDISRDTNLVDYMLEYS